MELMILSVWRYDLCYFMYFRKVGYSEPLDTSRAIQTELSKAVVIKGTRMEGGQRPGILASFRLQKSHNR